MAKYPCYVYTVFCIKIKKLDSISKGGIFQGGSCFYTPPHFPCIGQCRAFPAHYFTFLAMQRTIGFLQSFPSSVSNRREKRRRCKPRSRVRALPPTSRAGSLRSFFFLSTHSRFLIAQKYPPRLRGKGAPSTQHHVFTDPSLEAFPRS